MITMHGPAFDDPAKTVETEVHPANVEAFKRAGWCEGCLSKEEKPVKDEVTSPEVAAKAAKILKDPEASPDVKSVAASALTQKKKKK